MNHNRRYTLQTNDGRTGRARAEGRWVARSCAETLASDGAIRAASPLRCADARAQLEQTLRKVAGPSLGKHGLRPVRQMTVGRIGGAQALKHPARVGVNRDVLGVERDGRDGGGRVVSDAGQCAEKPNVPGQGSCMPLNHNASGLVKAPGPAVVPEPFPVAKNRLNVRIGQSLNGREALHPS